MYSILISLMLAVSYVNAIPMPLRSFIVDQPFSDDDKARHAKYEESLKIVNTQISNMKDVLKNKDDPRIAKAFGPNANHAEITKVVEKLESGRLRVETMNYRDQKVIDSGVDNGGVKVYADGSADPALFGHNFHISTSREQAGTIIHEATHQLMQTGDHVDKATGNIVSGKATYDPTTMIKGGGYAESQNVGGEKYDKMIRTATNTHENADSYRLFASLCSRSLFKRALLADDPVEYYLAKRSQCSLPKDYFAKKAAAKNFAAAKTTTDLAKGKASPAINGMVSTAKSAPARKTTTGTKKTTKAGTARKTMSGAKKTTFSNKSKGAASKAVKPAVSKGNQTAASPKRVTRLASRPTAKAAPKAAVKVPSPKKGRKSRRDLESIIDQLE